MFGKLLDMLKAVGAAIVSPLIFIWQVLKDWLAGRLPRWANWAVELTLVVLVVSLLSLLNWALGWDRYVVGPLPLRKVWLGLVALLAYLTVRLAYVLWQQIRRSTHGFEDIRAAVQAGCDAAAEARINLKDSPLYLVIGVDDEADAGLAASPLIGDRLRVNDPSFPLRWYGDADGIWVTLPGVSTVGMQLARAKRSQRGAELESDDPTTIRLSVMQKERARRRMLYAIKLLREIRNPVVPVNGVQLMIPYQWLADDGANQLADTINIDMRAAQEGLGVKCLCQVVFHGIDVSSEFGTFVDRTPQANRHQRCGCTLPQFTVLSEEDRTSLHDWLRRFFRQQVYAFYEADYAYAGNGRLLRFLDAFRHATGRFGRLLGHAFAPDIAERFYLGGVYFAALGPEGNAFFDGIAAKLASDHDEVVGWSDDAVKRDRHWTRIASLVAVAVVVTIVCDAVLVTRMLLVW